MQKIRHLIGPEVVLTLARGTADRSSRALQRQAAAAVPAARERREGEILPALRPDLIELRSAIQAK